MDRQLIETAPRRPGRPRGSSRYTGPTPSQRVLLERLRRARGAWVHIDALCDAVYAGSAPPLDWRSVLRKHLSELRNKHGLDVVNRYGGDYALMEERCNDVG